MNPKVEYLLRLGDSTLILAQRIVALCGHGPALEEDMAMSNVGLDLLGQTRLWYGYAAELEGRVRDEDQLAFWRDAHEFRNLLLVERPNGNYADTMVRQLFFDVRHYFLLEALQTSSDARIAEIAAKSIKEVRYHVRRSADVVVRLGDGTALSHARTQAAIDALWMYTGEMFESDAVEQQLVEEGVCPDPAALQAPWLEHLDAVLADATLTRPSGGWMQSGGRHGRHSEHFGFLLAEMQVLQRTHPGARW